MTSSEPLSHGQPPDESGRVSGLQALQRMVSVQAKLKELKRWADELQALQYQVSQAKTALDWEYSQAKEALELSIEQAPEELDLRVSDGALKWIGSAGAEVSRVEDQVRQLLASTETQP